MARPHADSPYVAQARPDHSMKRIQVLGGLGVFEGARPLAGSAQQPRRLAILAVLARAGSRGVSRDRLVGLLWPDTEEERGRRSLNQALYALRQELGSEEAILGTRDIRLNPDLVESDVGDFEAASASGALEEAAKMYAPFLGDFNLPGAAEFARWAEGEREVLIGENRRLLETVARAAAGRGDWGAAVLWWRRRVSLDPDDAPISQGLMLALAGAGDVPGALRHAEIFTELRHQLELPADPDVLALAERIRRGELPPAPQRSASHQGPQAVGVPSAPQSIAAAAESRSTVERPRAGPASIAVLPFVNMSPDRENEYFSDGLTEELTNALTRVAGLRVASRTSAFAFKSKEVDVRKIGARLGVTRLVEGSVRKVGNRIRVTAQLVSAADGYHLWSDAFDRTLTDVFALQEEVAQAIVAALSVEGHGVGHAPRIRPPTDVVEAYTLYLRGRYFVLKGNADSIRVAREYFEQALELDPHYALAYAGVAHCWAMSGFEEFGELPPLEAMPRAKLAADRALELDPLLAEGHLWRGVIALLFEYDPVEAEARLTRAIELQPSAAMAHVWRAFLRGIAGRHDEAIAEAIEAERLDPIAIRVQFALGRCYYFAGRYDEALRRFQTVLGMDPNSLAHAWVTRVFAATGRADLGLGLTETAMARLGRHPMLLEVQGDCLAMLGRGDEARGVITELEQLTKVRYVSSYHAATIYANLGEEEAAIRCLEEEARQRSGYLAFGPLMAGWESVHRTPRLCALMERLWRGAQMTTLPGITQA